MGTKIEDTSAGRDFLPTALIRTEGAMIKGVLKGVRETTTMYGPKPVYTLTALDAECKFTKGKVEVTPDANSDVDFFAPTRLARQLEQVPFGSVVTIKNIGKKKFGRGQPAHIFEVVLED